MYYRGSAAAVIVYDITKLVSLLPSWQFPLPVLIALVVIRGQVAQKCVFHIVPVPQLSLLCPCHPGLFPNAEEVGEGVEGTRAG